MKTKDLFSFLILSLAFLVSSCGGSSDDIIEDAKVTSISITSNKSEIDLGETLIFTVKNNLNIDLLNQELFLGVFSCNT